MTDPLQLPETGAARTSLRRSSSAWTQEPPTDPSLARRFRCWVTGGHQMFPDAHWVVQRDTPLYVELLHLWSFNVCRRCGYRTYRRDSGKRWVRSWK